MIKSLPESQERLGKIVRRVSLGEVGGSWGILRGEDRRPSLCASFAGIWGEELEVLKLEPFVF